MNQSKSRLKKIAVVTVIVAGLGTAGWVAAQGDHGRCHGSKGGHFGPSMMHFGDRIEGKLAFIKAELEITAEQEPAWSEFAEVMRDAAASGAELREQRVAQLQESETPERLDQRIDRHLGIMEQRVETMRGLASAAKDLYAELTPEQQAKADEMIPSRGKMRWRERS